MKCEEEESLNDPQVYNQEGNFGLSEDGPELPQIKEEQEEVCTSQEIAQVIVKQESEEIFVWTGKERFRVLDNIWKHEEDLHCTGPHTHDIIKLEENGPVKREDSDSVTAPDEDGFSVHSSGLDSADSDDEADLSEEMYPYYDTDDDDYEEEEEEEEETETATTLDGGRRRLRSQRSWPSANKAKRSRSEPLSVDAAAWKSEKDPDNLPHPLPHFLPTRKPDAAFQKLITMVTELTREVRDLREEFRAFRQSCSSEPVDAGILPLDLPLHNMDELNNAEATLQLPEANKTMVRRFSLIGGTTLEVRVRRILAYAITNELASGLNWTGRKNKDQTKQKRAFKETVLCKCIFDGLTQQVGVNAVSEFAFTQAVQKWLRYAPDRMGGAGRPISSPIPE
ncbi:uncharacterized protein LOC116311768 isoform X6 [Oreochromis aureus]|uniref:uncharacterized protein LOC116311768 isoform X6 n=1 Tax=Oreochromis aureus TaxID=47969 RepID=UPI0012BC7D81|nr:uncharacterized protein LOC116311768 isoform X6 [Oreochromis aureus]